jgi:thymidylate synthase
MSKYFDPSYQTQYRDLLSNLINHPHKVGDSRIGKINSRFAEQMRIDLTREFPLQEIKKIKFSNIVHELLWMIKGDTNIKYLVDRDCHIWTDDAYRYYKEKYVSYHKENRKRNKIPFILTKGEFVEKTLNQESLLMPILGGGYNRYYFGDLDKVYGKQWRNFGKRGVDQLQKCIDTLLNNPDDRRMIVTAHNPSDIEDKNVGLPSCHNYFQFYTTINEDGSRNLSTFVNIRSNDMFLGNPYNVAQYALLTIMVAKVVGMGVNELVINSVDAHLYHAHFDAAKIWLERFHEIEDTNWVGSQGGYSGDYYDILGCKAELNITRKLRSIDDISVDLFEITNYEPQGFIKAPLLT